MRIKPTFLSNVLALFYFLFAPIILTRRLCSLLEVQTSDCSDVLQVKAICTILQVCEYVRERRYALVSE